MKTRRVILFSLTLIILTIGVLPVFSALAQSQTTSQSFPRNLTIGSAGSDVASLQAFLIEDNFLQISGPTGIFGSLTASAVAKWQASIDLPSTGYFGAMSRASIEGNTPPKAVPVATSSPFSTPTTAPIPTSTPVVTSNSSYPRNLTVGVTGSDVSALQSFLITDGFLTVPKPTGVFGSLTATAVAKWQASIDLPSTGYFGAMSRADIESQGKNIALNNTSTASSQPSSGVTPPSAPNPTASSLPTPTPITVATATHAAAYISGSGGGGGGGGGGGNNNPPAQTPTPDTTPPTISLTNPADNISVSSTVTVTATAADNIGVTSVQFTLDGQNLGAPVTVPPYQVFLNPLSVATGTHELSAIAKDAAGNTASAGNITITVIRTPADSTPPTISITSPSASSTVTGNISITMNASDNVGVTRVEFYIDGILEATSTSSSPYAFSLNTQNFSVGVHTLVAKAYDAAGNVGTTPGTAITIVAPTPTVPSGLTIIGNASSSISLSWSPATEVGGTIAGYQLYRGNTQIATTTFTSFTNIGLASSTSYSYSVASFDANGVVSATSTSITTTTLAVLPALDYNFGLSVGENPVYMSSSSLNQEMNTFVSLGVGWIRFDFEWPHIQPDNSSTYNWSLIDPVIAAANAHNIKVLALLDFTPAWAASSSCTGGNTHCAPADPNAFATFAAAAAARYGPEGVSDWEIWNEPNNTGFWGPVSDCAAYTALLKAAYPAIKTANPSATVITAGLSPAATDGYNMSPPDFLSCIYANGGKNYFDAVGDHPYTFPYLPSNNPGGAWDQMATGSSSMRGIMVANGDSAKKIWVTEYGAPTNGPDSNWYVSESQQSVMLTTAYDMFTSYSWAGPFFWYTYQDSGTSTSTSENFFGLLRYDGSTKPAYTTLQNLISTAL
jgi:peptidoglycan hydrolase-like protein with peptidoglycan-binding domain